MLTPEEKKVATSLRDSLLALRDILKSHAGALRDHTKATLDASERRDKPSERVAVDASINETQLGQYAAKRGKTRAIELATLIVNGLTLIAVAVYAGLTYLQWRDLRHNFQVDERPWLFPDSPDSFPTPKVNGPVTEPITIVNIGKTPAKEIWGAFVLDKVDNGDDISSLFIEPPTSKMTKEEWGNTIARPYNAMTTGVLFPATKTIPTGAIWSQKTNPRKWEPVKADDKVIRDFVNGDVLFIAHGIVVYRDQFDVMHWTKYCRVIASPKALQGTLHHGQACTSYNGTDQNQ